MDYCHPLLPFGQHISVSTLVYIQDFAFQFDDVFICLLVGAHNDWFDVNYYIGKDNHLFFKVSCSLVLFSRLNNLFGFILVTFFYFCPSFFRFFFLIFVNLHWLATLFDLLCLFFIRFFLFIYFSFCSNVFVFLFDSSFFIYFPFCSTMYDLSSSFSGVDSSFLMNASYRNLGININSWDIINVGLKQYW